MSPTPWSVGATFGVLRTTIDFGDREVALDEHSAGVTAGYHPDPRVGVGVALGAILGGTATPDGGAAGDIRPGGLFAVSGTWLAVLERPRRPFVLLSAAVSVSATRAVSDDGVAHRLTSGDARAGVMIGKTLATRWVPYLAVRAFGGPVAWHLDGRADTGGDRYHVTAGGGLDVRLPANLGAFLELLPLGEQSASAGVTARF